MQNCPLGKIGIGYSYFAGAASHLQSAVLLVIRLAWGWELMESGYGHLTHVAATAQQFVEWGIPHPTFNAYMSGSTELIGGALLVLGLAARLISIPLIVNFCVAFATASRDNVRHLFSQNPNAIIDDTAFPFLIASLVILAFGPGKASIDYMLWRMFLRRKAKAGSPRAGDATTGVRPG